MHLQKRLRLIVSELPSWHSIVFVTIIMLPVNTTSLVGRDLEPDTDRLTTQPCLQTCSADYDYVEFADLGGTSNSSGRKSGGNVGLNQCIATLAQLGGIDDYLNMRLHWNPEFVKYIIAIIAIESSFNPNAISPRNAYGLMQMTQAAVLDASSYCSIPPIYKMNKLLDPETNIKYGTCYLHMLYEMYSGDWQKILVVYNGGYFQLDKYIRGGRVATETANYVLQVHRVLAECNASYTYTKEI